MTIIEVVGSMKIITFLIVFLGCIHSLQASELRTDVLQESTIGANTYSMEPSISLSSMNGGSKFMSIAMVADLLSWFSVGVEGDLPTDFEKQEQFYMARLLNRVYFLKSMNELYFQTSVSQGFFNGSNDSGTFGSVGGLVGYMRTLTKDWEIGGRAGVQVMNARFENGTLINDRHTLNSRLTFVGAYRF